jgi:transmembrane sensor
MMNFGSEKLSGSHDAIAQRAAAFLERQRFGGWSDTDQAELEAWLTESLLHEVAWLRLKEGAARIERLIAICPPDTQADTGKVGYRRFILPLLAAASVALAATFGEPFVVSLIQPPDRTYSTDVGGRTLLSFADHTQIELDTDTAVRFRMTGEERTVWLERGEAWFHVSHNAANPFTVVVGRHRVTDLGTEFLIRRGSDGMEVALLNGRATLSTEGAQTATLTPGDDAIATPVSMSVTRKTPRELANELAWRRGVLAFQNTRLADVVREFNRYNTTKLVIADPTIEDEKISADLKTDDYESFLQMAEDVLKLRVDREGRVILISRGQKSEIRSRKSETSPVIPGEPRASAAREGNPGADNRN